MKHLRQLLGIILVLAIPLTTLPVSAVHAADNVSAPYRSPTSVPVDVDTLDISPQVDAGGYHTCAVRSDGSLACWGDNTWGIATPPADAFTQVSAGQVHTCALRSNGTLACWGNNDLGQLNNIPTGAFTQVSAGGYHTCALRSDGTLACWGFGIDGQTTPPTGTTFTQVSAGLYHTCAVQSDGSLACWGMNDSGEATPPTGATFTQISAGWYHNCAVRSDGSLACWGLGNSGQATPPDGAFTQVSAGRYHTCAVRNEGTLACWGTNGFGQTNAPSGTFTQIGAGMEHTCALRSDETLVCWGLNNQGQAPVITVSPEALPAVTVGEAYNQTISGSGGASPYTFAVVDGALPDGLTLAALGELSGTPITAGTFDFTVQATDSSALPFSGQRLYSLIVEVPMAGAFNKSAPVNGGGGYYPSSRISWAASEGAESYEYCIDLINNDACDGSWVNVGLNRNTTPSGLALGQTYYWQVRSVYAGAYTYANAGTWWSYSTRPGSFNKSSPVNGGGGYAAGAKLLWTVSTGAQAYEYCIDQTNDNACDGENWISTGLNRNVAPAGVVLGKTYYWQVRSLRAGVYVYANGGTWWSYSTKPGNFNKSSPADGATGVSQSPTLSWTVSTGATEYQYCIDATPGSTCEADWVSMGTSRTAALTGLDPNTTYYWQVRSLLAGAYTYANANTWRSFTTAP